MKLKYLAETTGVPATSIKYYLRDGLLMAGEKLNATTASYGTAHVDRLELIKALRHVVGLSLKDVRAVVKAVESPEEFPEKLLMGFVQSVALGLPGHKAVADSHSPSNKKRITGAEITTTMGWSSGTEIASAALDHELEVMAELGMEPSMDVVLVYARAVDVVAAAELSPIHQGQGQGQGDSPFASLLKSEKTAPLETGLPAMLRWASTSIPVS